MSARTGGSIHLRHNVITDRQHSSAALPVAASIERWPAALVLAASKKGHGRRQSLTTFAKLNQLVSLPRICFLATHGHDRPANFKPSPTRRAAAPVPDGRLELLRGGPLWGGRRCSLTVSTGRSVCRHLRRGWYEMDDKADRGGGSYAGSNRFRRRCPLAVLVNGHSRGARSIATMPGVASFKTPHSVSWPSVRDCAGAQNILASGVWRRKVNSQP